MRKLGIALVSAAVLALTGMVPAQHAAAQTSAANTDPTVSDLIWSGLWSGVNFNFSNPFSSSSRAQEQPQTPAATPQPAPITTAGSYVALGDSVAAGIGLPTVSTVPSEETRCGRTQEAYPYAVAAAIQLPLIHLACSGATAGDLITQQRVDGPNPSAQLGRAYASGTPQLITITAGANDAHWQELILNCYYRDCATVPAKKLAEGYLLALQGKLFALFTSIQLRSGGTPPTMIYTGYYNPASSSCTQTLGGRITSAEVAWITGEVNSLNSTIQQVASYYPFVRFAPVDFTGHDVCSTDSWIQGIQDSQPLHPTAAGQQAIAQSVLLSYNR